MTAKRLSALALLLLFLLTMLTGCWDSELEDEEETILGNVSDTAQEDEEDTPQAENTGLTAFTLPYFSKKTLDPITCESGTQQMVATLLYEGLFVLDGSFAPQNVLCESYSYDSLSKTYTFTVAGNAVFSDGTPVSAQDVLSTYQRAAQSERYSARFATVTSMNASGKTLTVTLSVNNTYFPALLDIPIVKAGTETQLVPLGSGPYIFADEGSDDCLLPNENWWQEKTLPTEKIPLSPNSDSETLVYQFNSRQIQCLTTDLTGSDPLIVSGRVSFRDYPTSTMLYLGFNTASSLFSDAAVRSAVSLGMDRETIVSAYLSDHALPAFYPISPVSERYPADEPTYSHDAFASAMEALELGGRPSATLLVNSGNSVNEKVAAYIVSALEDYIRVNVVSLPWEDYLARLRSGNYDFYLAQTRMTADWNTSSLLSASGKLNYGYYHNESLDLYSLGMQAGSDAAAAQFYKTFAQECPIAPLCFKQETLIVPSANISGASPSPSSPFYGFENWTIDLNA